jgi:hypothetical protein
MYYLLTLEFGLDQEDLVIHDPPEKAKIFAELANWTTIRVN